MLQGGEFFDVPVGKVLRLIMSLIVLCSTQHLSNN